LGKVVEATCIFYVEFEGRHKHLSNLPHKSVLKRHSSHPLLSFRTFPIGIVLDNSSISQHNHRPRTSIVLGRNQLFIRPPSP